MTTNLSGPTTGTLNSPITYTVAQSGPFTGVVTLSDSGSGGLFVPDQLLWAGTQQSQTFKYIPQKSGTISLSIATSASGAVISGSPISLSVALNVALSLIFAGPTPGNNGYIDTTVGVATGNFTVTPNGLLTATITPWDGGQGGSFSPSSLTFSGTSAPQTFTYTPAVTGYQAITLRSTQLQVPPLSFLVNTLSAPATTATLAWTAPSSSVAQIQAGKQVPTPFTITLNGSYQGVITLSDGSTGTFQPSSKVLYVNPQNNVAQFWYTPPSGTSGSVTISVSASPSLSIVNNNITVNYNASTPWVGFGAGKYNPFYYPNPNNN